MINRRLHDYKSSKNFTILEVHYDSLIEFISGMGAEYVVVEL